MVRVILSSSLRQLCVLKRVKARLLAFCLLAPFSIADANVCPFAVTSQSPGSIPRFGIDVLVLLRHALRVDNETLQSGIGGSAPISQLDATIAANRERWDVDGDLEYTSNDAVIIARYLAGFSAEVWANNLTLSTAAVRKSPAALRSFIVDDGCPGPDSVPSGNAFADAGPDIETTLPAARVRLAGTARGASAEWTQISGPAPAIINSNSSPRMWVAARQPGSYVFRLVATDSSGVSVSDEMTLTVRANPVVLNSNSRVLNHFQTQVSPAFKANNTLLPLTISYGGEGQYLKTELAQRWGFAYQFPMYGSFQREPATYWDGDTGNTMESLRDIRANRGKYKISATTGSLYRMFQNYDASVPSQPVLDPSTWLRAANGSIFLDGGRPVVSPLARDDQLYRAGEFVGNTLAALEEATGQRIGVFLNEGEYGLWIPGENSYEGYFGRDPSVLQAFQNSSFSSWAEFISFHKARQERQLKLGVFKNVKKPPAYSWYQESYGGDRGRWFGWSNWMFRYEQFIASNGKPLVSDYAQPETYYNFTNSGWTGIQTQQGIPWDALTVALKSVGGSYSLGQRNFYPWVSMGGEGADSRGISDDERYLGMLKMWYAAGAIGSVAGYFTYDEPYFTALRTNGVVGVSRPTFVRQAMLHAHAHALFTHLEDFLRGDDLLPGPNSHPYSDNSSVTPAMEFPLAGQTQQVMGPSGPVSIPTARILVRKMRNEDRWLFAVWANAGDERTVTANIDPRIGSLNLAAPKSGAVYVVTLVNGSANVRRIDVEPMDPTKFLFP